LSAPYCEARHKKRQESCTFFICSIVQIPQKDGIPACMLADKIYTECTHFSIIIPIFGMSLRGQTFGADFISEFCIHSVISLFALTARHPPLGSAILIFHTSGPRGADWLLALRRPRSIIIYYIIHCRMHALFRMEVALGNRLTHSLPHSPSETTHRKHQNRH